MKIHRLAKYFPVLEGEEFDQLVEDIKAHGQRHTITMVGEEILDGVNRYKACQKLGIEPRVKQLGKNEDPLDWVISENIRRRHLSQSQKAALAVEMLPEFEKEADERGHGKVAGQNRPADLVEDSEGWARARDQAAKAVGTSGRSVAQAKRVKEADSILFGQVVAGEKSVDAADEEISLGRYVAEKEKKATKKAKKIPAQRPKAVAEYYEACTNFKDALKLAIAAAKQGMFAKEGKRFAISKHDAIRELMVKLEESI